ncbi:hypothetical protein [Actinopolymorpha pittospori]
MADAPNWFRRRVNAWRRWWRTTVLGRDDDPLWDPWTSNTRLALGSSDRHFPFRVELAVEYSTGPDVAVATDPFLVAQAEVAARAEKLAALRSLTEADRLRAELEAVLQNPVEVGRTGVIAWAHCTEVMVDPELRGAVNDREQTRQQIEILRWQRELQEYDIQYWHQLLTDPGRATAWWFAGDEEKIHQLLQVAGIFTTLRDRLGPPAERPAIGPAGLGVTYPVPGAPGTSAGSGAPAGATGSGGQGASTGPAGPVGPPGSAGSTGAVSSAGSVGGDAPSGTAGPSSRPHPGSEAGSGSDSSSGPTSGPTPGGRGGRVAA